MPRPHREILGEHEPDFLEALGDDEFEDELLEEEEEYERGEK
jgi:hypothetical protein